MPDLDDKTRSLRQLQRDARADLRRIYRQLKHTMDRYRALGLSPRFLWLAAGEAMGALK